MSHRGVEKIVGPLRRGKELNVRAGDDLVKNRKTFRPQFIPRGEPAQWSYGVVTAPGETCGPV